MSGIVQQVGFLLISWVFWFVVLYLLSWLYKRKSGKTIGKWERILLVGEVSLLCAAANIAISLGVKLYNM